MCWVHIHTIACILGISMLHVPSQVEVKGLIYTGTLESSQQSQVSVLVNQLDQNFTKGENHTVRVFVTNSVGTSNPLSTLLRVPCESLISCMCHNQLLMSTHSPHYQTRQPGCERGQFPLHHGTAGWHRVLPQHHSVQHIWNSVGQHYRQASPR